MTDTLVDQNSSLDTTTEPAGLGRGAAVMTAATVVVGAANYGMALLMARLLSTEQFSRFASGQGLLLVIGTGSMAALPWAVSHYLADSDGERNPSKALYLGLVGSAMQAVVLGVIAFAISLALDGMNFALAVLAAVVMISLLSGPVGFFQGRGNIVGLAVARLLETAVRIGSGLLLVLLLSRTAVPGLLGFAVGAAVAVTWLVWKARDAFPLRRPDRLVAVRLARQAVLLGAIQVLLSMLGALDTVYVAAGHFGPDAAASYQSAAIIGRVPLFISSALSIAGYTSLVSAGGDHAVGRLIRSCLSAYTWLVLPIAAVCATVPGSIFYAVVPPAYTQALPLLRLTVLSGAAVGMINVLTTAHQARGRFRGSISILAAGALMQAVVLLGVGRLAPVTGFALATAALLLVVLLALAVDAHAWLRARPRLRPRFVVLVVLAALVLATRDLHVVWVIAAVALTAFCFARGHSCASTPTSGRHQRKAVQ